jgi:energy-coupling factor transporter ATP-binding protein EcfA2
LHSVIQSGAKLAHQELDVTNWGGLAKDLKTTRDITDKIRLGRAFSRDGVRLKMQLESVKIEGLFGRFNYDINLRRPDKITIIHAPNGFGKTVLLNLINAFFTGQFAIYFKHNFSKVYFRFDNSETISISKRGSADLFEKKSEKERPSFIDIGLDTPNGGHEFFSLSPRETVPEFARYLPFIEPAGPDLWMDDNAEEFISTKEVLARYSAHFPATMRKSVDHPQWLKDFTNSTECRLIETQRLLKIAQTTERHSQFRRTTDPAKAVVEMEARDLARRIGVTLAEYANRAQTLDQSFPRRVIAALRSSDAPQPDDVSQRLRDVDKKRSSLIAAGLLDKIGAPEILSQAELVGQQVRQVIGVYLDDMEQKFSRFDQLFKRVSLFKEIIGEKFQFKDILVSREKGFSVKADDGAEISLLDLSSGEQHELVMLYELLFGVQDDALILIDEPELSLHVGWQVRFLPDLQRIQQLRPMQIIMATHSPQIINDRWDLTVELKAERSN